MNKRGKKDKRKYGKKAVSPVVSTVLLIVLVVILAVIIFLWARGFIQEKVEKFDKPIETMCSEVNLDVSISGTELSIINQGDVPVYNINIKKQKPGESEIYSPEPIRLRAGASIPTPITLPNIEGYDGIIVIPVLLGKSGNKNKQYTCPEDVGVEIEL